MELTKEMVLEAVRKAPRGGLKTQDLAIVPTLDGRGRHRLRRLLQELMDAGGIERGPGARYYLPGQGLDAAVLPASATAAPAAAGRAPVLSPPYDPSATHARRETGPGVTGRIRVHPAGYGFVQRDDGEDDVFVPARFRGHALDGDKVRLSTWMGYKGTEGKVEEVLDRGRAKLTGTYRRAGHHPFLEPDDPRIASAYGHIPLEEGPGMARDGDSVVAQIIRYPGGEGATGEAAGMTARVSHVLGSPDDPRTEIAKILIIGDIPEEFPEDVLAAGKRTPQELRPADFADRIDLRDRPFLTIDPETARDFDDAICLEERGDGFRLWVAVADVSHYVSPGGALDREAVIRGVSVYLPDRAIPMLPRELSSGICSLNPEVDRCAMVVRIDLDKDGVPVDKAFAAAVIRSHARLDYPGVAAALAGDFRGARARYRDWIEDLKRLDGLAKKMRARRRLRGSLDFDLPEAKVILDEDDPRLVRDVRRSKADADVKGAYQLVEEYMLAANEAVAEFFHERELDTLWRVHDVPSIERLEEFAQVAESFGITFDPEQGQSPLIMQEVLKSIVGKPYERSVNFLLLRSLKQATYDIVNIGHYGLAAKDYLHFTSPIRRYPDLIVHRLLKYHLRKDGLPSGGAAHAPPPPRDVLAQIAAECSTNERRASTAEREVVDMYRAFLMRDRIGEELDGIISGVTNFGFFVEAVTPFVEGLIKAEQAGESLEFDERGMRLVARRSGRAFVLGDAVRVRVENVSVARRKIDMALIQGGRELTDEELAAAPRRGAGRGKPERRPPGPTPGRERGRGDRVRGRERDKGRGQAKETGGRAAEPRGGRGGRGGGPSGGGTGGRGPSGGGTGGRGPSGGGTGGRGGGAGGGGKGKPGGGRPKLSSKGRKRR